MPTTDMPALSMIAFAIGQALVMLALAPLMAGISRMVRARGILYLLIFQQLGQLVRWS